MIFKQPPPGFTSKFDVVTAFLMHGDHFLVLQYSASKKVQPNRWGTPAGKLDPGEDRVLGLIRELTEETQLIFKPEQFAYVDTFFIRYPTFDYTYHIYKATLSERPADIRLDMRELQAFRWVTATEAAKLDLIDDELPCIQRVYTENV